MKSVLIVGAGPAGLVAAKTLLQHGGGTKFNVTIFEAAGRVGGMWRSLPGEKGDKCSPHMRTNLSRFTVSFSDLSWVSVDLSDPLTCTKPPREPPMFPKAWQVGRYLETYAKRFLPENIIRLNRRVKSVELEDRECHQSWSVTSVDQQTHQECKDSFDYLIIASGFFDTAARNVRQTQSGPDSGNKIQHSSEFRDVSSLVSNSDNIVVIGGGISGSEAAATAAFQISNAKYRPGKEKPAWQESKVYHVFNRPFYCLPRYLPQDPYNPAIQDFNLAPSFLPLDLVLYSLSRRAEGVIAASIGQVPSEKAQKGHVFIRSVIGGDQRDTGRPELVYKPEQMGYPAYTGVSDLYAGFVRSGMIIPIHGRVEETLDHASQEEHISCSSAFAIEISNQGPWASIRHDTKKIIDDVAGIIEATGFQVHLEYLSDNVKLALGYDQSCHRVPFLLSHGSIFNHKVPNIAFVGFYEGPYWGVMEGQARTIAQAWSAETNEDLQARNINVEESRAIRQAIKSQELDVPQFWMADYAGLVEELSRNSGMQREDSGFGGQSGPAFPARYRNSEKDTESEGVIREVADILQQSQSSARFVAAAAFRGMQGGWTLQRKIDSRHASMPGETFKGTAYFHPRVPTDLLYEAEYVYIEEGTLTMDNGMSFPATRRYIYRYDENTDVITAWFVEEDGLTIGSLFNTWEFYKPSDTFHGWLAKGSHWCSPDTYRNNCEFRFRGAKLETFGITYDVAGPKKDYSHESWYSRPKLGGD